MPVTKALEYEQSDVTCMGCQIPRPEQQVDAAVRSAMHRGGRECVQRAEPVFARKCRFHDIPEIEPSDAHAALRGQNPSSPLFFSFSSLSSQKIRKRCFGLAGGVGKYPCCLDLSGHSVQRPSGLIREPDCQRSMLDQGANAKECGQAFGVDPVWWSLGGVPRRAQPCRRHAHLIRLNSAARWLIRCAGRDPEELAKEFEPTAQSRRADRGRRAAARSWRMSPGQIMGPIRIARRTGRRTIARTPPPRPP